MTDTLTATTASFGVFKAYSLSTPNTLNSHDPSLGHLRLEGSTYGRAFSPTNVTISYYPFTRVKVFKKGTTPTTSGSVTYYDPATIKNFRTLLSKTMFPLTAMPSWLSTLVNPNLYASASTTRATVAAITAAIAITP